MTYEELKKKIIELLDAPYDPGEYKNLQEIEDHIDMFFLQEDEITTDRWCEKCQDYHFHGDSVH